jgi:hypothetical protein
MSEKCGCELNGHKCQKHLFEAFRDRLKKKNKDHAITFRTTQDKHDNFVKKLKQKGYKSQTEFFETVMDAFIDGSLF